MSRQRGENFDKEEKAFVVEAVREKKDIIESTKNDVHSVTKRTDAWKYVASHLAAAFKDRPKRTVKQLKDLWRRTKIKAKNEASNAKKSQKITGGGEKEPNLSEETQLVIGVLEKM